MTANTGALARLLEQVAPPLRIAGIPPGVISENDYDVTDLVLATWPDAVRLLTDMAEALRDYESRWQVLPPEWRALLARFAELEARAAQ